MTTDKKPDGFCAWHPEKGYLIESSREEKRDAHYQLGNSVASSFPLESVIERANRLLITGWQIKPVWLSDTPPVSEELVGLMIKYITHLMDESGTIHPMLSEEELKKLRSYIKPEGDEHE